MVTEIAYRSSIHTILSNSEEFFPAISAAITGAMVGSNLGTGPVYGAGAGLVLGGIDV